MQGQRVRFMPRLAKGLGIEKDRLILLSATSSVHFSSFQILSGATQDTQYVFPPASLHCFRCPHAYGHVLGVWFSKSTKMRGKAVN
jgi:hypothetical protein